MINITDVVSGLASERLKSILKDEGYPESWLHIVAAPDTQEGATYLLNPGEQDEGNPIIHFYANNVHVVVDRKSNLFLSGIHIDPAVTVVLDLES